MRMNAKRTHSIEEIWEMDGGITTLNNDHLRLLLSEALSKTSMAVAEKAMEECIFLMVTATERGSYFPQNSPIKGKTLIAFPESILEEEREEAIRTVLHEVAHHYHSHQWGLNLSVEEYDRQEKEANDTVKEWLDSG